MALSVNNRIGVDLVDNRRIKKYLSGSFLRHILSEEELAEYSVRKDPITYVAGRIAAKEAILKCLVDRPITDFTKITITNGPFGEPMVHFEDFVIQVSISHEKDYTVAVALIQA